MDDENINEDIELLSNINLKFLSSINTHLYNIDANTAALANQLVTNNSVNTWWLNMQSDKGTGDVISGGGIATQLIGEIGSIAAAIGGIGLILKTFGPTIKKILSEGTSNSDIKKMFKDASSKGKEEKCVCKCECNCNCNKMQPEEEGEGETVPAIDGETEGIGNLSESVSRDTGLIDGSISSMNKSFILGGIGAGAMGFAISHAFGSMLKTSKVDVPQIASQTSKINQGLSDIGKSSLVAEKYYSNSLTEMLKDSKKTSPKIAKDAGLITNALFGLQAGATNAGVLYGSMLTNMLKDSKKTSPKIAKETGLINNGLLGIEGSSRTAGLLYTTMLANMLKETKKTSPKIAKETGLINNGLLGIEGSSTTAGLLYTTMLANMLKEAKKTSPKIANEAGLISNGILGIQSSSAVARLLYVSMLANMLKDTRKTSPEIEKGVQLINNGLGTVQQGATQTAGVYKEQLEKINQATGASSRKILSNLHTTVNQGEQTQKAAGASAIQTVKNTGATVNSIHSGVLGVYKNTTKTSLNSDAQKWSEHGQEVEGTTRSTMSNTNGILNTGLVGANHLLGQFSSTSQSTVKQTVNGIAGKIQTGTNKWNSTIGSSTASMNSSINKFSSSSQNTMNGCFGVLGSLFASGSQSWYTSMSDHLSAMLGSLESWGERAGNIISRVWNDTKNFRDAMLGDEMGASGASAGDMLPEVLSHAFFAANPNRLRTDKFQGLSNGKNMNVTINSPKHLDPFEVRKQLEQMSRNMANGFY